MEFLIYLIKSAALLSLFFLMYKAFFSRESFLQANRIYLILGLLFSFSLPLITFTNVEIIEIEVPSNSNQIISYTNFNKLENSSAIGIQNQSDYNVWKEIAWHDVLLFIYATGMLFFFYKLIQQTASLFRLLKRARKIKKNGISYFEADQDIEAFSIFNIMAYNPQLHKEKELAIIKTHEKVHIKQWHSIDMLLGNMACVFFWFFPVVYWYRAAIDENLEYIADAKTAEKTQSIKKYQYTLLNYFSTGNNTQYANYFFKQSSLKNRIIMLNKEKSNPIHLLKYSFVIPLIICFIWLFQTETLAKEVYIEANLPNEKLNSASIKPESNTAFEVSSSFQQDSIAEPQLDKIEAKINSNSTDKSLEDLEAFFAENHQKLKFSKVKRNESGKIKRIKIKLTDAKNGIKKETFISGNEPIKEMVITRDFKNETAEITESTTSYDSKKVKFHQNTDNISSQKEKIEAIYIAKDYIDVDGKRIDKKDINGKILVYKNLSLKDGELVFENAKLHENEGAKEIAGVLTQIIKKYDQLENQHVLWFKNKDEIELASIHHSKFTDTKINVEDSYVFEAKEAAIVDVKYVEKSKNPIYILNGKIIGNSKFRNINPAEIESVSVIKNYQKLDDSLKVDLKINPEDFPGAVMIQLKESDIDVSSSDKSNSKNHIQVLSSKIKNSKNVVTIVNNEISDLYLEEINPDEIASIFVLDKFEMLPNHLQKLVSKEQESSNNFVVINLNDESYYKSNFEILVTKNKDEIVMECNQGCAWKEITFTLKNPRYINAQGVSTTKQKMNLEDKKLSNFNFKITQDQGQLILDQLEGSNWEKLGFSIRNGQTYKLNQDGIVKQN